MKELEKKLAEAITLTPEKAAYFFKTKPGDYGHHDRFMGIRVPTLRQIAKEHQSLTFDQLQELLDSPFNEKRLLSLFILVLQYKKGETSLREKIFRFYLTHRNRVNNWNLVDASAHLIVGAHLLGSDKQLLLDLARSKSLWDRRIAIVATWQFIRKEKLDWTFQLATLLMQDKEDLIHKAVGWMLREAGKKDEKRLIAFLQEHEPKMPRTMFRYAKERLSKSVRMFGFNK